MNELADRFAEHGVGSVFLYTHEAHPGENYPHQTSMDQKFAHAAELRDKLGVSRPILLDSLDGACHRFFGSMPNMTWIINRAGRPIYKSDWTDAVSVANALDYQMTVQERRRNRQRMVPCRVERVDFRPQNREGFYKGLERSGPKAVEEFRAVFWGPEDDD